MSALLGIVCGMEAEAAALGPLRGDPRLAVAITGGRPDRAEADARDLAHAGVRALLSWGIAGGLDPALAPGALVVPDGVIGPGGQPHAFDARLVAACRQARAAAEAHAETRPGTNAAPARPPARGMSGAVLLAGSEAVVLKAAGKAALRRRTNAAAVDMESHRLAAVARGARLPCLAIRAVSDPSGRRLPALAAHALDAAGRPRMAAVLGGLARRPWDLGVLLAAGRDSRAALAALDMAAGALLPVLLAALAAPPAHHARGPASPRSAGRGEGEARSG